VLAQLSKEFPEDLRVVYRHFPLSSHDKAQLATQAAEAAGLQGKFWEMHDLLYENQATWSQTSVDEFQSWLIDQAEGLGLDVETFTQDLTSEAMIALAQDAWEKNTAIGMPGTPFLLINGRQYNGRMDYGNLEAVVKMLLLEQQQFTECPPMTLEAEKQYFATLETERGDIRLELFADIAPLAVNNFIFLARQGWYDNVTFHRVLPDFMAQAGDPTGTGFGGPGYAFDNEVSPELKFDQAGILAMANAGPGSNGSQFFITLGPAPHLDGGYTIFGRVVAGMEVVESLTPRDPAQSMDLPPGDLILRVIIEEQ
jgi:cyclophilin family peptidyl-prolyl cis-trans isomerase